VHDLLRLARLDAGQETPEVVDCAVASVFADVQADLAPLAERRGHRITAHVARGAEAVRADPAELHDVIRNLVENAIRHTPDGTAIELSTARDDDRISILVADDGPGIPESDLSRVFERFYRVDKARSRDATDGGTGLGLAIVKHLVGLHGGTVEVANRPHGGAVFTVTLPAAARRGSPRTVGQASPANASEERSRTAPDGR